MTRTIAPYLSKYAVVELVNTLESTFLNYEQCHSGERYKGHHGPLVFCSMTTPDTAHLMQLGSMILNVFV